MKLEFKQIACYFPYELKIMQYRDDLKLSFESILISLSNDTLGVTSPRFPFNEKIQYHEAKPILRPLSDFEKVICKELMIKFSTSLIIIHEIWSLIQKEKTLNQINYETYLFMCKNHVDFNNLIENNLAIDINTINQ